LNRDIKKNTIKKGLTWDLVGSFFRQFVSFFITIILARLLSPEEFGVVGMAIVFISITQVFIDVGFTSGIIQRRDVKGIVYSSVFYANLSISILLSLLILLVAPYVGDFYGKPEVGQILKYLAIIPPIGAFGQIQSTILTKKMDFKSLSLINVISTFVGGTAGVIGALMNMGVYSLVLLQLFTVFTSTLLLWYLSKWRPKWEFSIHEIRSLLGFSSFVFFDQVLRQIFNKIDTIYIGKVFTPAVLGFYSRAESLKAQINTYTTSSLRKIMFPALCNLQHQEEAFKKAYQQSFNLVTGVIVLIVGPIYFLSEEIIIGLFGAKWRPSVVFFQILIFTALTSPHVGIMAQAVLAKGYSKLKFKTGLIQRLLKLTPVAFGFWFGDVKIFCIAVVGSSIIVFFVYSYVVYKKLEISFVAQMRDFFAPNILFFLSLILFNAYPDNINKWLFAISFPLLHIIYLKLLKHESYIFILNIIFKFNPLKLKI